MKRTPWFHPSVKPVRVGLYECKVCCIGRQLPDTTHYWTGKRWTFSRNTMVSDLRPFAWRGLSSPQQTMSTK